MENNLEIIGNESSALYYNLNRQYSTVRKVIITHEEIFSYFEDSSIEEVFSKLEQSNLQNYLEVLSEGKKSRVFDGQIKADLYKLLNETLPKISSSMADIKLKEYNFMNSVSNTKFTVTIRCESFSITKYYLEKAELLSTIRNLLRDYFEFKGNMFRASKIKNFQVEVYESEEIAKSITLKKEGSSLILSSCYGFLKNSPIDYTCGNEMYVSEGEKFNFYKNFQSSAIVREYSKLVEAKVKDSEKILSNDELIMLNNATKHINDVIIEMYINRKGALRILNISLAENSIYPNSQNGFIINRSSKNYEKIDFVSLRDNLTSSQLDEEIPKFLLIRNENEVKDLFFEFEKVNLVEGIIINTNFYSPILDKIGQVMNLDIIYYAKQLHKLKDVKLDLYTVAIETPNQVQSGLSSTPFTGILNEQRKGLNAEIEKLRQIEASVQSRPQMQKEQIQRVAQSDISDLAQGLISSPNASTSNNTSKMAIGNSTQGKKSAIGFLADVALASVTSKGYSEDGEKVAPAQIQRPTNTQDVPIRGQTLGGSQAKSFIRMREPAVASQQPSSQSQQPMNQVQQAVYGGPQEPMQVMPQQTTVFSAASILDSAAPKKPVVNQERYNDVIAVKILTNPGVISEGYFADANNISEIQGGEIYYLTTNPEEMTNTSLKYILPVTMYTESITKCHLLINSITEFFLIENKKDNLEYFVNLSHVDASIKKNYLKSAVDKFERISVIMLKEDVEMIENIINKVDAIYLRDIENDSDMIEVKNKILSYEKRFILKNF